MDHMNGAVLLFNHELSLTFINSAGEILLDDSAKHLIDQPAGKIFKLANSDILQNIQQCQRMFEPLIDRELPLYQIGNSITVNFSATPIIENGQLLHVLVELQQVDRQIRITKEEQLLEQQNTSRMLIKGLAHEIKNPLGGLRGAAQLLDLELKDPELKEYTQIIIAESDRLRSLMDKMLGPNKPAEKSVINIHETLERVRQLVNAETHDNIQIVRDYDPSLPNIYADKNQLIQAFLNISRNAVQALKDSGEIIFRTRIKRYMAIGRRHYKLTLKVEIIDNGPGIQPELMGQIFYPMITSRAEGTGLGLSISQSLINQHNGLIECNSHPGQTVFSIYLPLENGNATS